MKLLLDTALPKMLLILFNDNGIIFSFIKEEKKKADLLPKIFQKMLIDNKMKASDINRFYVTNGPGSFMGSRTGLTFIRTICQITGAQLFLSNTLEFLGAKLNKKIFLDAKSHKSYMFDPKTKKTKLVDYQDDTNIDYEDIINNLDQYLISFKESNADVAKTIYFKDPRIGG